MDAGSNGTLTYTIVGGTGKDYFAVDSRTGVVSVTSDGAVDGVLNFEDLAADGYDLEVKATDGGGLSARATFSVAVTDVNEPPVVMDAVRSILENSLSPAKAGKPLNASDPDNAHPILGERQQLIFSISDTSPGDGASLFKIDACSGQLEVREKAKLNYEVKNEYTVGILVRDDGKPQLSDESTVTVRIIDANDAPVITLPTGETKYSFEVMEGSPVDTPVESTHTHGLLATDEDVNSTTAAWSQLSWSI